MSLALLAITLAITVLVTARGQRHPAASIPASVFATARAAVTVPPGYQPPADRVPTTGAYLPANGKPTLVFVDAIW